MENKFANYLIWGCLVLALGGLLWMLIEPIINWSKYSEIRLYVRIFLFTFVLNTFAVLRLYNSIVQNTRFSIKLREVFIKLQQAIPGLERSMKNLNSTLGNVKSSSDSLRKELSNNSESVDNLSNKLKNM